MSQLEEFKDSATRVFGDNVEQRHTAGLMMNEALRDYDGEVTYSTAVRNLETSRKLPAWFWAACYAVMLTTGLSIVVYQAWQLHKFRATMISMSPSMYYGSTGADPYGGAFAHLSGDEKLLLFGDTMQPTEDLKWRALWESRPEDASYYVEYLKAYRSEHGDYPPDMIETGERLSPGNAWFRIVQSGVYTKDAVEKKKAVTKTSPRRSARRARGLRKKRKPEKPVDEVLAKAAEPLAVWTVKDDTKYRRTLELFHQAAAMPSYDSGMQQLLNERVPLLPQGGDWVTRTIPIIYLSGTMVDSMEVNYTSKVIQAEAQRCRDEKDKEALKRLMEDWEKMGRHLADGSVTLIDALIAKAWIMDPLPYFRDAAKACGMPAEEKRFAGLYIRMLRDKKERKDRRNWDGEPDEFHLKSGMLAAMIAPVLENQVNDLSAVDAIDLEPGRMADHAFIGRLTACAGVLFFAILPLGIFLDSLRSSKVLRILCASLRGVLGMRDWILVLGCGMLLPLAYYAGIVGMSPWSARHASVLATGFTQVFGQLGCLWLLLIAAPAAVLYWRLSRLIPPVEDGGCKLLLLSIVCLCVAVPMFGVDISRVSSGQNVIVGALVVSGLGVVLGLAHVITVCVKNRRSIRGSVLPRALIPVYISVSLLMALLVLFHHAEEKYWVSQDEMMKITPENASFTQTESQVTRQVVIELKNTMGWAD